MIKLCRELTGKILDVGGGGEGVIGRLYTDHVIAIDNRKEELDEAPEGFKKMLMDATDMSFDDNTFDCVTAFYSLMFMNEKTQEKALSESARVLKEGGELHMKTDNRDLFLFSIESLSQNGFGLKNITWDLHNSPFCENNIMTEYETHFSSQGLPIYRLEAFPL